MSLPLRYLRSFVLLLAIIPCTLHAQPAGTLDPSFADAGRFVRDFGFQDNLTHVTVQPADQKIVAVGTALTAAFAGQLLVIRLLPDGTPDSTFNGTGVVVVSDFQESYAYRALVSSTGKLLVAGTSCDPTYNFSLLVMRFNDDGSRDTTFGQGGVASVDLSTGDDMVYGITELPDNRLVLAGLTTDVAFNKAPILARLEANGSLDSTFGVNGIASVPVTSQDNRFWNVAAMPDGRIVACGHYDQGLTGTGQFNFDFLVARFLEDGSPDNGFGTNGVVTTPYSAEYVEDGYGLALDPDGGCYVSGYTTQPDFSFDLMLAKYDSTGALDTSFDGDGIAIWDSAAQDIAYDMLRQPDGKLLLAGTSGGFFFDDRDFLLVRYRTDGSLDTDFDADGYSVTTVAAAFDEANAVCLQADGRIIAAGKGNTGTNNDVAVMRFYNDLVSGLGDAPVVATLACWPVPARAGSVVTLESGIQPLRAELIDLLGRRIVLEADRLAVQGNRTLLRMPASLQSGTYQVRLLGEQGIAGFARIVIAD